MTVMSAPAGASKLACNSLGNVAFLDTTPTEPEYHLVHLPGVGTVSSDTSYTNSTMGIYDRSDISNTTALNNLVNVRPLSGSANTGIPSSGTSYYMGPQYWTKYSRGVGTDKTDPFTPGPLGVCSPIRNASLTEEQRYRADSFMMQPNVIGGANDIDCTTEGGLVAFTVGKKAVVVDLRVQGAGRQVFSTNDEVSLYGSSNAYMTNVALAGDGSRFFWMHHVETPGNAIKTVIRVYRKLLFTYVLETTIDLGVLWSNGKIETNETGTDLVILNSLNGHARFLTFTASAWTAPAALPTEYTSCVSADISNDGTTLATIQLDVPNSKYQVVVFTRVNTTTWAQILNYSFSTAGATVYKHSLSVGGTGSLIAIGVDQRVTHATPALNFAGYVWLISKVRGRWKIRQQAKQQYPLTEIRHGVATRVSQDEKTVLVSANCTQTGAGEINDYANTPFFYAIRSKTAPILTAYTTNANYLRSGGTGYSQHRTMSWRERFNKDISMYNTSWIKPGPLFFYMEREPNTAFTMYALGFSSLPAGVRALVFDDPLAAPIAQVTPQLYSGGNGAAYAVPASPRSNFYVAFINGGSPGTSLDTVTAGTIDSTNNTPLVVHVP